MQNKILEKSSIATIAIMTGSVTLLLAGCGAREENVVVAPPQVVKKTTIEKLPEEKPKTIIVQFAPKPAPKTKTETNVTVEVKPQPKPQPAPATKLPEPAPAPKPDATKLPPPSTPAAAQPEKSKPKPASKPAPKSSVKKPEVAKSANPNNLKVRAEVIATSKVPDPKSVPYKDALVFTKYKILKIENGEYKEQEILVAQWAMKNKKLQPAARQRVGEVRTLTLQPLSKRPDLQSVMRNDDTEEFALEPYFAE